MSGIRRVCRTSSWAPVVLTILAGCASVEPTPVADFNDPSGIPYYGGSYYLLIYPDGKGNVAWSLEYAMDPNFKMEYRTSNTLASNTSTLTFENGLLKSAETTSDSSAIVQTITSAVGTVLSALANRGDHAVNQPQVYKIVPVSSGLEIVGDYSGAPIVIRSPITTVPPKTGESK